MDLKLKEKTILVIGASSGLGRGVVELLLHEGANVIAFARGIDKLHHIQVQYINQLQVLAGDVLDEVMLNQLVQVAIEKDIDGVFVNAGGPPAKSTLETNMKDWDAAYHLLVRWKIDLILKLIPHLRKKSTAHIVFNESISVKQPVANLVLSNSMRMAVVGFVKTLSQEIASEGVNLNILAPGYHETDALNRIFEKKSEVLGVSVGVAKNMVINSIPVNYLGKVDEYASLACWLLSDWSSYITGQTISIDGGVMQGAWG